MTKYKHATSFITAIGTSVPQNRYDQDELLRFMEQYMELDEKAGRRLEIIARRSGIRHRHSVLPDYDPARHEAFLYPSHPLLEPFPTVERRMECYRQLALPLAAAAIRKAMAESSVTFGEITHLITVSCTGMYAPGLDIELVDTLGLPRTVSRTAINFMGCYGAFNGIKAASAIVTAEPDAKVIVVCAELCSLHFQKHAAEDQLLSNMLFADGAAAALVEGDNAVPRKLAIEGFACDLFPEGKDDMAWYVRDHGFEMKLTARVPAVLRKGLREVYNRLLEACRIRPSEVSLYAIHPGGPKILEAAEQALEISKNANRFAYEVLRDYGNMSSATLFFVLEKIIKSADDGLLFAAAFGPGLTCETALLRLLKV